MQPIPEQAKIVTWHGEGRTLWYVVDASAPEDEQQAVLLTLTRFEEVERIRKLLVP